ncbi:hypothetical protein BsWGS_19408 [Bradybaena similaris]
MAFYSKEEDKTDDGSIADYDAVLFTVCDMLGRPQGRFAVGKGVQALAKQGLEMSRTSCVLGFCQEKPLSLLHCNRTDTGTFTMLPDLSTLRPLSWLCIGDRKIGHVLCDLYNMKGHQVMSSPRAIVLKQLHDLKDLGFMIMTAYEVEFIVYQKGTLKPFGGERKELANMMRLDTELTFYYDLMTSLLASGIPIETQMEESAPGQIEYSMRPLFGITMADSVHRLRYITKSVCDRSGLMATFMARPTIDKSNSGFHLNHSLWTLDGQNAFYDPDQDHHCSEILRHWVAGLIHHGGALTALMNPTVNCYQRLHNHFTPTDNIWNYNDRNARLRVKNKGKNVHVEERMPSSACNPYVSLAALIAAGTDGIARKLEAPPPRTYRPNMSGDDMARVENPLPRSLDEALHALEKDSVLIKALGEDFVQDYAALCRWQLRKLEHVIDKDPQERYAAERDLYLHSL